MDAGIELVSVEVQGKPRSMGRQLGEQLREEIREFCDHRLSITAGYLDERGYEGHADLTRAGDRCLAALEDWDPAGAEEHVGVAEGAGVVAADLYAAANYSDIRDLVLLHEPEHEPKDGITRDTPFPDDTGCTAFALPKGMTQGHRTLAGQTWDLHPRDMDFVIAVKRMPAGGRATWSLTTVGCPTLIGMNEQGLYVGTTNIKVRGVKFGVGYLSVLHRALGCQDVNEAAKLVHDAPRAAAHTFWLCDEQTATELECSADRAVERHLGEEPLVQTNHALDSAHAQCEAEPASDSSIARLARACDVLAKTVHDVDSLKALMADRSDGVDSINRYHADGLTAATNGCAIGVPSERTLHACRGPADLGVWKTLGF